MAVALTLSIHDSSPIPLCQRRISQEENEFEGMPLVDSGLYISRNGGDITQLSEKE